jgi:hypothetical protein
VPSVILAGLHRIAPSFEAIRNVSLGISHVAPRSHPPASMLRPW